MMSSVVLFLTTVLMVFSFSQVSEAKKRLPRDRYFDDNTRYEDNNSYDDNGLNQFTSFSTQLPEVVCPLVDQRPMLDVQQAAENLAAQIKAIHPCDSEVNVKGIQSGVESMQKAATIIQEMMKDPELLTPDSEQMTQLEGNLVVVMKGIDSFAKAMGNNRLLNDKCGREMMRPAEIIDSLGELTQAITPIAIKVLGIMPEFTPAIPFLMGLNGAASVTQLLNTMYHEEVIKMDSPQDRETLVQNVCEYSRIVYRVNAFKRAKQGQLSQATKEMLKPLQDYKQKLFTSIPSRLSSQAMAVSELTETSQAAEKSNIHSKNKLQELKSTFADHADSEVVCLYGMKLAQHKVNKKPLGVHMVDNLITCTQKTGSSLIREDALIDAEKIIRSRLLAVGRQNVKKCSELSRSYYSTLIEISELTDNQIEAVNERTQTVINKNPTLKAVYDIQSNLDIEMDRLIAIANAGYQNSGSSVLGKMGRDNSALTIGEIDRQIMSLKVGLFGSRPTINLKAVDSPSITWLYEVQKQMAINWSQFKNDLNYLRKKVWSLHTRSGLKQYYLVEKNGKKRPMTVKERERQVLFDIQQKNNLVPISPAQFTIGTMAHTMVCQDLEKIWFSWYSVLNYYQTQEQFCATIASLRNDLDVQANLKLYCWGAQDLKLKQLVRSEMQKNYSKISEGSAKDADLIESKINELQCNIEMPRGGLEKPTHQEQN